MTGASTSTDQSVTAAATGLDMQAVQARRRQAGLHEEGPLQALALSGGGIRSATFCFGLVRALAKNGALINFDYLSTVSGGGYVGSAVGRLYCADKTAAQVQEGLGRDDSVLVWWLRSNGRYLTPAGLRDLGHAFASILRGVLSTHFEVGMLLLCGAALLLLPYVVLPWVVDAGLLPQWAADRPRHGSFWWWAMAVPLFTALHHIFAYWFWRSTPSRGSVAVEIGVAVLGLAIAYRLLVDLPASLADGPTLPAAASALAGLLLLTPMTAEASRRLRSAWTVPQARLAHTKGLAHSLWSLLALALLGALDFGSWLLADRIDDGQSLALTVPSAAALITAVRLLLTKVDRVRKWVKSRAESVGRPKLLNLLGIVVLAAVAVAWVTLFQWLTARTDLWQWAPALPFVGPLWDKAPALGQWLVLATPPMAYLLLTGSDLELLNLSSLHNFYRARIERAYVSTGNSKRFADLIFRARTKAEQDIPKMRLAEAVPGDDIDLAAHRPHLFGGPIHLVNCCINQTVDDRTGSYNADRKGVCLTVSALGAETGTRDPDGTPVPGKLSMWAAVSGAAASSGMGSQTSPGLAALMFLSGLRLGYWQEALGERAATDSKWVTRPQLVAREALARFPGLQQPQWYLSDGGHFENTAVYALLKRAVGLVVLADCGADPAYRFDDLENLVRKAKIDYCADIGFVAAPAPPAGADACAGLRAAVGLPRDFKAGEPGPFLLLARIDYLNGATGALVVVKPRLVAGLPLDLLGYARQNTLFPEQATADQFFDEAQWEGYHQLGLHLGQLLTPGNLQLLQSWAAAARPQA